MNKFLIILLIAFVASATVTIDTEDLNGFFNKTKDWFQKINHIPTYLTDQSKDYYNWLKDKGYLDNLVEHTKAYGKEYALDECVGLIKDKICCSEIVNAISKIFR